MFDYIPGNFYHIIYRGQQAVRYLYSGNVNGQCVFTRRLTTGITETYRFTQESEDIFILE